MPAVGGNNFYSVTLTYPPFPGKGTISGHPPKNPKKPGFWGSRNPLSILRFFILPPPLFVHFSLPWYTFGPFRFWGLLDRENMANPQNTPFLGCKKGVKKGIFCPFLGFPGNPGFGDPPFWGTPQNALFWGFFPKMGFLGVPLMGVWHVLGNL